ncbi:MAG: hypothetical protein AAFO69_12935 [Bacteroidota bacterium]
MRSVCMILLFPFFTATAAFGQDGVYDFGGKSAGMANSSVTLVDAYSVFNNIGALADVEKTTAFAGYRNLFGINELNTLAAGFIRPTKPGTFAVSFYRFGGDLLNQQKASLGFSNKIGLVSLGVNLSYVQYSIETLGRSSAFVMEFGGLAELTKQLKVGAYVFNLNQANLGNAAEQQLPVTMKVGLSYLPTDELTINVEVLKQLDAKERIRVGINYQLIEKVSIRTGIETSPVRGSFGLGFNPGRFLIDYAYGNQEVLGDIHDLTLAITL